jgi:hypothetical protein
MRIRKILALVSCFIRNQVVAPCAARFASYHRHSGEAREWYERFRNDNWGLSPPENNGYLLQRLSAYIDFHVKGHVRLFAQPMSAIGAGRKGGPRPVIDESKLFRAGVRGYHCGGSEREFSGHAALKGKAVHTLASG